MNVPTEWVEEHRAEIEREAFRIHNYRISCRLGNDNDVDNWITACRYVYVRYHREQIRATGKYKA